jgi:hypothetical protein
MRLSGRTTQPYRRRLSRAPSATLTAQKRGRTLYGHNPQDIGRLAAKKAKRRRRRLT